MSKTKKLLAAAAITLNVLLIYTIRKNRSRKKRSKWSKTWLQRRQEGRGTLSLLNNELRNEDPNAYKNFIRVDDAQFKFLLNFIEKDIKKECTLFRDSISAKHRLDITLRFLATGETYRSLMYSTRVHESTISKIVPEVCSAIYKRLKGKYLKTPTTNEEWMKVAVNYENKWNFPNCLGALDGRHITFAAPISSGSYYYNYKGTNSIVLLGLVDANYRFIYVNVGVNGRVSDGGVFQACKLFELLEDNRLGLPSPTVLPGRSRELPFVFIADDAFPLMENLMKPFPQRGLSYEDRIYNYRLSRARRMVESAFGILANRWRILLKPIQLSPEKVEIITLACITLHNFLATENLNYIEQNVENNIYDLNLQQVNRQAGNNYNNKARLIREEFKAYFNSPIGTVPWQETAVKRGNWWRSDVACGNLNNDQKMCLLYQLNVANNLKIGHYLSQPCFYTDIKAKL